MKIIKNNFCAVLLSMLSAVHLHLCILSDHFKSSSSFPVAISHHTLL